MSIALHCSECGLMLIDWTAGEGSEPCLATFAERPDVSRGAGWRPIALDQESWTGREAIASLLVRHKPRVVVLSNLLGCMGPLQASQVIRHFREMVDAGSLLRLAGASEVAWAELPTLHGRMAGIEVIRGLRDVIGTSVTQSADPAISERQVAFKAETHGLSSLLSGPEASDAIRIRASSARRRWSDCWLDEWTVDCEPILPAEELARAVVAAQQRCACDRVLVDDTVAAGFSGSGGSERFASWLAQFRAAVPAMTLSVCLAPAQWKCQHLRESLAGVGLEQVVLGVTGWKQWLEDVSELSALADWCHDHKIAVTAMASPLDPSMAHEDLLRIWRIADRLGLDMIELLARMPGGSADCGPVGDLASVLAGTPSLLHEYSVALMRSRILSAMPTSLHPSWAAFYRTDVERLRSEIAGAISRYCVLGQSKDDLRASGVVIGESCRRAEDAILTALRGEPVVRHVSGHVDHQTQPDTAIVVISEGNEAHLRLCLRSISRTITRPCQIIVSDRGPYPVSLASLPANGQIAYEWLGPEVSRSFVAAVGLSRVWEYDYVLLLDCNSCALSNGWLDRLIAEFNSDQTVGAIGVQPLRLDYHKDPDAAWLRDYTLRSTWRAALGADATGPDDQFLPVVTAPSTTCLNELTGWVQLYRGATLRRIGLPVVDDPRLSSRYWDSELSMRVLGCGLHLATSNVARSELHFFGNPTFSAVPDASGDAQHIAAAHDWLSANGHDELATLLASV